MRSSGGEGETQTEELFINGASFVFYSVYMLNKPFNDSLIEKIGENTHYTVKKSNQGYTEKIFNLNNETRRDHLVYETDFETQLTPLKMSTNENIHPKVKHYVTIYSRQILLIQSIILFDKNKIINFKSTTLITKPITTDDILKIIHKIKNSNEDWNDLRSKGLKNIEKDFLLTINNDKDNEYALLDINQQEFLSVQIWDIENTRLFSAKKEVSGTELVQCYKLELSAILSHNETLIKEGLWRQQSPDHVRKSALLKTDVLKDHAVRMNETACVEISQVNYPKIKSISSIRLKEYGYDSTSIFLCGYIIIMNTIFEKCNTKVTELYDSTIIQKREAPLSKTEIIENEKTKRSIIKELKQYDMLKNSCIERRHKDFLSKGAIIRGLLDIQQEIHNMFDEIKNVTDTVISTEISDAQMKMEEIKKKEFEQDAGRNKTLAIIEIIVTIIGIIVAIIGIIGIERLEWFNKFPKTILYALLVLVIIICVSVVATAKKFSCRKK